VRSNTATSASFGRKPRCVRCRRGARLELHRPDRSRLKATRGKIYGKGGAAEMLGLKPGTLQSKMVKLGIQRDTFT
jgi:transcriptional regulator with GAF, ATPase, and Fis domain